MIELINKLSLLSNTNINKKISKIFLPIDLYYNFYNELKQKSFEIEIKNPDANCFPYEFKYLGIGIGLTSGNEMIVRFKEDDKNER